jgi:uracil-DNA glycosylase
VAEEGQVGSRRSGSGSPVAGAPLLAGAQLPAQIARPPGAGPVPTTLREHARYVQDCTACDLHRDRVKAVAGEGPADARLLIVGATPRRHEDLQGVPLAGACRNVLDHGLAAAGLRREDVRVTSVVRCRPADDRTPALEEIATCRVHLRAELDLVKPEVIVTLGAFATAILLGRPVPIERVAGYRLDVLQGITLVPTYHPNDAVRGVPQAAPSLRRDLQVAKAVLDGRLLTGAETLAELRSRAAAGT